MSPIEMLSHSNRLPVPNSLIYEEKLYMSMIVYPHNVSQFEAYFEYETLLRIRSSNHDKNIPSSELIKIIELSSDPLSFCQFHVIGVSI